jgi:hypothetical protein
MSKACMKVTPGSLHWQTLATLLGELQFMYAKIKDASVLPRSRVGKVVKLAAPEPVSQVGRKAEAPTRFQSLRALPCMLACVGCIFVLRARPFSAHSCTVPAKFDQGSSRPRAIAISLNIVALKQ